MFEMIMAIFGDDIIYVALIFALLSIGGTFICTVLANITLNKLKPNPTELI